jgi:sarcosine oxidase delta subunit
MNELELAGVRAVLSAARAAVDVAYEENSKIQHTGVDYDHYVYLRVAKRQRRLWSALEEFAKSCDWLEVNRDTGTLDILPSSAVGGVYAKNAESRAAHAAASVLNVNGIRAQVEEHWR